jgi:SAM-dependent methyltransferase
MHYQPVYTDAVRRPLRHLVANYPIVGASSACFIDLGCGRGKALHVARAVMQHVSLIGVDLHPDLLNDAARNLGVASHKTPKVKLILSDVNAVDYAATLASFDVVIAFNKNSFDKATTENTLAKLKDACKGKALFYVYNNPVFSESFAAYQCIFDMSGWHKNWNTKTFRIV